MRTIGITMKTNVRKNFSWLLMPGVLFCILPLLFSCSDDDVPPASAVDDKPWNLDKNMDESYRPGDNFYMYCNGTYWNNTDCEGWIKGFFVGGEVNDVMLQRCAQIDDPRVNKINADFADYESGYEGADAGIRRLMEIVDRADSPEALWRAMAQIMREGGCTLFDLFTSYDNEKTYAYFEMPSNWSDTRALLGNWMGVRALLRRSGMSEEDAEQAASLIASIFGNNRQLLTRKPQITPEMYLRHPELKELFSFPSASRAAVPGEAAQAVVAEELGIAGNVISYDYSLQLFAWVEALDVTALKAVLHSLLALDYLYVSPEALDEFNQTWEDESSLTIREVGAPMLGAYFAYATSYAFAAQYVTAELKQQYMAVCEEMRQTFHKRIEAVDWMSATTKTAALEKLEAMRFDVGYPDVWMEEGLAPLDGASLVEDVMQLRKAYTALRVGLAGQNAQDANFNDCIATPGYELILTNAFYNPMTNNLCIYPCFMLEPLYSPAYSDAFNYAVFMAIGHEMTHGFDSFGANYDKIGNLRNWWTVADKMEFEDRQQLLIDCYDQLELLPDEMPGVYAPGEQTLTENIADLGGFLIAHQAYMERLDRDGYTGEERLKQERKFFQGFAELWRSKYSPEYVNASLFEEQDVHSMSKERVNGVVMNCDRWYELYDVQEGDKLYLPVERRTYLW